MITQKDHFEMRVGFIQRCNVELCDAVYGFMRRRNVELCDATYGYMHRRVELCDAANVLNA